MKVKDVEHRLLIACINTARTLFIEQGKPTEDVDELLMLASVFKGCRP